MSPQKWRISTKKLQPLHLRNGHKTIIKFIEALPLKIKVELYSLECQQRMEFNFSSHSRSFCDLNDWIVLEYVDQTKKKEIAMSDMRYHLYMGEHGTLNIVSIVLWVIGTKLCVRRSHYYYHYAK